MTIYKRVTKRNSEKYFKDFLDKKELSLQWLFDFIEEQGGDKSKLDFSPESLIYLWEMVSPYIKEVKPCPDYEQNIDKLPLWFFLHYNNLCNERDGGYDILSLKIMEALVYYFAEVFIKNNGYKWKIWDRSKPRTDYNYLPVIETQNGWIYPFEQIRVFALRASTENSKYSKTNMYDVYKYIISEEE